MRTSEEMRGLRRHCGAFDREVAVNSMSGDRMSRFSFEEIVMDSAVEDELSFNREKCPIMLTISPSVATSATDPLMTSACAYQD